MSVIVPTYRRSDTLSRTLRALLAVDLRAREFEIFVVDDARDPATESVVASLSDAATTVRYLVNTGRGAAAARNTGARAASGELLLFLDDDMMVCPDHLQLHLETHTRFPHAMVGGDRWYSPDALIALETTAFGRYRIALERSYADGRGETGGAGVVEVATLPSFDLSLSREAFWAVGGFDESFPFAGAEDQDLSTRAKLACLRLLRNHDIKLLHEDQTTTLRQFSRREQQGAHTVVALVRKFPEYLGEFYKNDPLSRADSLGLIARKCTKSLLSSRPVLAALHGLTTSAERLELPDRLLRHLYRLVLGLHIFRGYREALVSPAAGEPHGFTASGPELNDVATLIVAHNDAAGLPGCIESVRAAVGTLKSEIVVVDAGSTDDTFATATELGVKVVRAANIGYGAGNNLGWRAAEPARYLFVLNPDAKVVSGSLERLIELADRTPNVGVMAPLVVDHAEMPVGSIAGFKTPWRELADRVRGVSLAATFEAVCGVSEFDWAHGCALLFRSACFATVGGFDERFFLYFEEEDIQRSTSKAGWEHQTYPDLVVEHSTDDRPVNPELFAQIFRAKLHLARKWGGPGGVLACRFGLALDLLRRTVLGDPGEWAPAYHMALRALLTERVYASPQRARQEQIRRTI